MDIKEYLLDEIVRLTTIAKDSSTDGPNRRSKASKQLRKSFSIALPYLGNQPFAVAFGAVRLIGRNRRGISLSG